VLVRVVLVAVLVRVVLVAVLVRVVLVAVLVRVVLVTQWRRRRRQLPHPSRGGSRRRT
jgi:hypothetical protein